MNDKEIQVIDFAYLRMCAEHNYIYETGEAKLLLNYITNLQQENARLKDKINMAIKYYELNQQECVIGRNKDEKLIKEYYLPAQCSKKLLDILKEN